MWVCGHFGAHPLQRWYLPAPSDHPSATEDLRELWPPWGSWVWGLVSGADPGAGPLPEHSPCGAATLHPGACSGVQPWPDLRLPGRQSEWEQCRQGGPQPFHPGRQVIEASLPHKAAELVIVWWLCLYSLVWSQNQLGRTCISQILKMISRERARVPCLFFRHHPPFYFLFIYLCNRFSGTYQEG